MIPVVAAAEMAEFEQCAATAESMDTSVLMERAAAHVACAVKTHVRDGERVSILIGSGNNGGDGLAALRMLHGDGIAATGILVPSADRMHGLGKRQLTLAAEAGCFIVPFDLLKAGEIIGQSAVAVDALFGTGLSREITGAYADAVACINRFGRFVIAVDLPSGIHSDTGRVLGCAVQADSTVTFQFPKRGLLLFPGRTNAGSVSVCTISGFNGTKEFAVHLAEETDAKQRLPKRPLDSHKGKNGKALLIAGCETYTGAALLSSAAALRAGCGILTVCVPGAVKPAFSALPQAICIPVNSAPDWSGDILPKLEPQLASANAIAMGPGVGADMPKDALRAVLHAGKKTVLDADGLNLLSRERDLFRFLHKDVILTPHVGEMARLLGTDSESVQLDPIEAAQSAAREWNCCVLLKGATSVIASPGQTTLTITGNPGLSKAGSGDMLTGIILALLAQGLVSHDAAWLGAYLLGTSADTAFRLLGERMLVSGDILDAISMTLRG